MEQKNVKIGAFEISNRKPFSLLCGPCQIESKQHAIDICGAMSEITGDLDIPYVFKASFDKANRSSINGARGVGLEKGMETFDEIKKLYNNIPMNDIFHSCHFLSQNKIFDLPQLFYLFHYSSLFHSPI